MKTATDTDSATEHISREAGDKTKGFRFQKLRAAIRFLLRVEANPDGQVQCALELLEDSIILDSSGDALISGEENKFYGSGLSFNSAAIRNTVVAFLDLYFTFGKSSELKLGVYASADLSRERVSADLRQSLGYKAEIRYYEILRKLVAEEPLSSEELDVAFAIVKAEYSVQYDENKGYSQLLKDLSLFDFQRFISSVEWSVTNNSNESLEEEALCLIKNCRFFNHRHDGLERYILTNLLDELEKRSGRKGILDRLMTTDALNLIFSNILVSSAIDQRQDDPAADDWTDLTPSDNRNLEEKVLSVCPSASRAALNTLARKCSLARRVEPGGERESKALLRRILDVCEEELLSKGLSSNASQQEILDAFDELTRASEKHLATLRSRYRYHLRDEREIKGAVLTLFDDCFLAFDEVQNEGE